MNFVLRLFQFSVLKLVYPYTDKLLSMGSLSTIFVYKQIYVWTCVITSALVLMPHSHWVWGQVCHVDLVLRILLLIFITIRCIVLGFFSVYGEVFPCGLHIFGPPCSVGMHPLELRCWLWFLYPGSTAFKVTWLFSKFMSDSYIWHRLLYILNSIHLTVVLHRP